MNAPALLNAATEWDRLKQELIANFGGGDDTALVDTVSGMSNLPEMIQAVVRSIGDDEALLDGLGPYIDGLKERFMRIKARAQAKRECVETAMVRADLKKIEFPEATLVLAKRFPKVIVTDESIIPPAYFSTPAPVLSKSMLAGALKDGIEVPGAMLGNGSMSLTLRRK
jgi:hypothetical protein